MAEISACPATSAGSCNWLFTWLQCVPSVIVIRNSFYRPAWNCSSNLTMMVTITVVVPSLVSWFQFPSIHSTMQPWANTAWCRWAWQPPKLPSCVFFIFIVMAFGLMGSTSARNSGFVFNSQSAGNWNYCFIDALGWLLPGTHSGWLDH
jgi:hypothetical protein